MSSETSHIAIDAIDPPTFDHRVDVDETMLRELADSIREVGLVEPIVVRRSGEDHYEIIAGHRRYLAHRMLQLSSIMATIVDADDLQTELMRAAENMQRSQLSPMEEARALRTIMDNAELTPQLLAQRMGRNPHWIGARLALLSVPDDIATHVHLGDLPVGHALVLAGVADDQHRGYLTRYTIDGGASLQVVREWVRQYQLSLEDNPEAPPQLPDPVVPGQRATILIPCATCGAEHPHTELVIIRVCRSCGKTIAQEGGADD